MSTKQSRDGYYQSLYKSGKENQIKPVNYKQPTKIRKMFQF